LDDDLGFRGYGEVKARKVRISRRRVATERWTMADGATMECERAMGRRVESVCDQRTETTGISGARPFSRWPRSRDWFTR
jgi:hypothetical protein